MSATYTKMENGKVVMNCFFEDEEMDQCNLLFLSHFDSLFPNMNATHLLEECFIDFMIFNRENPNEEMIKGWIHERYSDPSIKKTVKEWVDALPSLDLISEEPQPFEKEIIMTNATTQQAAETASEFVKKLNEPVKSSFDWAATGKTIGVFALGAAAGAAGKWAWSRFFG